MSFLERRLITRGYELDREGVIPPAALLRYMEHVRWACLEDSTLQLSRLFLNGHFMVVAAQSLQREQELGHHTELSATLGIGHVGRSSFAFRHLFRRTSDDVVVARGSVTVVYLSPQGRSMPLPEEVAGPVRELTEDAWEDGGELVVPQPPRTPPPSDAWTHALTVRPSDLDVLRHVNHATYLTYFEDARALCAAAGGYGAPGQGAGRVRALTIEYLQQATQSEAVVVETWLQQDGVACFVLRRVADAQAVCRAALALRG
jgi:acyl-CoA thioesterase FadM